MIDDGVDLTHPDLAGRKWTNPDETPGNGVDDDSNGYIDDVNGWNCHDDSTVHDVNHDGHGTHVAGTIATSMNGTASSASPCITIMALKFIDDTDDCGSDAQAIDAIDYAAENGATLINASWGGTDRTTCSTRRSPTRACSSWLRRAMRGWTWTPRASTSIRPSRTSPTS